MSLGGAKSILSVVERRKLSQLYLKQIKQLLNLRTSTPTSSLLRELSLPPLEHKWLLQTIRSYNSLCALPDSSLYRQIAQASFARGSCWAKGIRQHLTKINVPLPVGLSVGALPPFALDIVQAGLARAQLEAFQKDSSAPGKVQTYARNFAPSQPLRRTSATRLSLPAKHVKAFIRFKLGVHNLPVDKLCQRSPMIPRWERKCHYCDLGAVGDERHFVFECTALGELREHYSSLFSREMSLHAFISQRDENSVAAFVWHGFSLLKELDMV